MPKLRESQLTQVRQKFESISAIASFSFAIEPFPCLAFAGPSAPNADRIRLIIVSTAQAADSFIVTNSN